MKTKLILAGLVGLIATTASAQSSLPIAPRWSSFTGCWDVLTAEGQDLPKSSPRVCIVPTSELGADLLSISDHKITDRTHLEGDGARQNVSKEGCAGWETATWSPNGRRLYLTSAQQCGSVERKTSGIFAVSRSGQLINIVNVAAGGGQGLRRSEEHTSELQSRGLIS